MTDPSFPIRQEITILDPDKPRKIGFVLRETSIAVFNPVAVAKLYFHETGCFCLRPSETNNIISFYGYADFSKTFTTKQATDTLDQLPPLKKEYQVPFFYLFLMKEHRV